MISRISYKFAVKYQQSAQTPGSGSQAKSQAKQIGRCPRITINGATDTSIALQGTEAVTQASKRGVERALIANVAWRCR
jgi:hypothetical protein